MKQAVHLQDLICLSLYKASRHLIRMYGPLLAPFGLTYPQFLVLQVLWEKGASSVRGIGDLLALDSATLTPLLKKLEQRQLVTRARSIKDERIVVIDLTDEGQSLKKKLQQIPKEIGLQCGFSQKDVVELQRMQGILEKIGAK